MADSIKSRLYKRDVLGMVGVRYGNLTVNSVGGRDNQGLVLTNCTCTCGAVVTVRASYLHRGKTKSCYDCSRTFKPTHGKSYHPLHIVWVNMRHRTTKENRPDFKNYGGRGLRVCSQWRHSFESFYNWAIANGWRPGLEIDRRDNDGDYTPDNCRFVSRKVNGRNRRVTKMVDAGGTLVPLGELCETYNLDYSSTWSRLKRNVPVQEIINNK